METEARNMRLLAHSDLAGAGGGGEGMGLVERRGRRTLFVAHESGPHNFTVVDVTQPDRPAVIAQTYLAGPDMRSNSLSIVGDLMAVAYETKRAGMKPAGMELFDISDPSTPRSIGFFDASGPHSRGAHFVWLDSLGFAYLATGMPDWQPRREIDYQFVAIVDVRDPTRPREVGRWWLPGTAVDDTADLPIPADPADDTGYKAHNINVYPQRPDRAYVGYKDGGVIVLDIADRGRPSMVSRWDYHPPMRGGFTHTVVPLFERELLLVSDEADIGLQGPPGWDHPKLMWVVDARLETNLVPLSTLPMPRLADHVGRGGFFGAHNVHENDPVPTAWHSETMVVGTFFNAGVRAYDISDALRPEEIGHLIPPAPPGSRFGAAQMNDVYVDENRVIYALERTTGGLYIMELTA